MIDPRLNVLRVVARTGTITAAAATLGYTPSAVSHQLRALARELKVPLLEPEGRNVRLTAAAATLLRRSDELFAHWESIHAELQQASGAGTGRLGLVGFSTAASALLPAVALAAMEEFPRSRVEIVEADPTVCVDMLLSQTADVAVVVGGAELPHSDDGRFVQQPLLEDPLDLLVPRAHRLASQRSMLLEDAADEPWLMDRPGSAHHQLVVTACAAAGFSPHHAHRVAEWDTGAALVAAGLGVALVPRLARVPGGQDLVRVPLRGDPTPSRRVRTMIRAGTARQPEIALALRVLGEVAEEVSDLGYHRDHAWPAPPTMDDGPVGPAPV